MLNTKTSKSKRKNMNLSAAVFSRLERMKSAQERKVGVHIAWDNFFLVLAGEVERLRKLEASR